MVYAQALCDRETLNKLARGLPLVHLGLPDDLQLAPGRGATGEPHPEAVPEPDLREHLLGQQRPKFVLRLCAFSQVARSTR